MSAISAATPSIGDTIAQLISSASPAPATVDASAAAPSAPKSADGPATVVSLSDQAKAAAAARAVNDQAAAERLQAFVEAHRVNGNGTAASTTGSSDGSQPTTGTAKVAVIVAQIKTLTDADEPPPFQAFTPTKTLSNSLTVDGFTLSVFAKSDTQLYGTALTGNDTQVYDYHFGPSDEGGGGTGAGPGVSISKQLVNNNEALEAITVTRNVASLSSASVSSSTAGSAATSSVNAQSSSITFLVNYATGKISATQSSASVSARAASVSPGTTLSTFA